MCAATRTENLQASVQRVVLWAAVVLMAGLTSGQRHFFQRFYGHMFAHQDTGWQDRECLLSMQGREYVGTIKTPEQNQESLRCLLWEDVVKKVSKYDKDSKISNKFFPGFKSSVNRQYCRNPGGIWSQPGCFLQFPKNKKEEKRKAASCGIPMCPILTQFRSCPAGREYGGKLDLRNKTECVDRCLYRHTLLGPACTLVMAGKKIIRQGRHKQPRDTWTSQYNVYYPCDVPLLDGETMTMRANIEGASVSWSTFRPVTWYLTPGKFINLTQGAEGRVLLRLPHDILSGDQETTLRFHVRLGDPMDVGDFEFEMFLSPDTSLMEVVTVTIDINGIHLLHKVTAAHQLPKARTQLVHASKAVPWASLMYRWVELHLTIRSTHARVSVFGAGKDPEDVHESGIVEISTAHHSIQMPRYVHLASLGGTTLAVIDSIHGGGYACTEGVVKLPLGGTKYHQWAVLPTLIPEVPTMPVTKRVPYFNYSHFSDRVLHIQVFNAPFSLWLSSAPILQSDIGRGTRIIGRRLNVVQILVGRSNIRVTRCGALMSVDRYKDEIRCVPGSWEVFNTRLRQRLRRGQEVVVHVAASEGPHQKSSLMIRVELHVSGMEQHTYKVSHPVFPRYWTLVKSKNPTIGYRHHDSEDNKFLFFRILNSRCKRTFSFLNAWGCRTDRLKRPSGRTGRQFYQDRRFIERADKGAEIVTRAMKNKGDFDLGPMFQQSSQKSCLSWAAFAIKNDESELIKKTGNQCFLRETTGEPFCYVDLWGTKSKCELDQCTDNYVECFDRSHVVSNQSYSRGHCLDGTEVFIVNVGAIPSPANPTHYVLSRKYDFEVKAWDASTKNMTLCVYLYNWKELEVIFRIEAKQLVQNRPQTYDMKWTSEDVFLEPWRYTPYSVLDADGKWTLYHEEHSQPLLTHYTHRPLARIGFDACSSESEKMIRSAKYRKDAHVLVKLTSQTKTPTLTHYFETSYFPKVSFDAKSLTIRPAPLYSLIKGHNTFLRIVDNQVKLWVKGHSEDLRGGVLIFLLERFTPQPEERIMIHFDRSNILLLGRDRGRFEKKVVGIKNPLFPLYPVEVDISLTYTNSRIRVRVRLSSPSSRRRAQSALSLPKLNVNYVALLSYNASLVQWSLGDKMPPEEPRKKPVNGRWSRWVQRNCSKPCGGGEGVMERYCTNPPPSLMGRDCVGPSQKVRRCNMRKCGRLSKELEQYIRRGIIKTQVTRRVSVFSPVRMACPKHLINRVTIEYPEVVFFWQHHTGRFFQNVTSLSSKMKKKLKTIKLEWLVRHVYAKASVMVIDAAVKELSGLWLFVAETEMSVLTVVHVVPLVVEDTEKVTSTLAIEGEDLMLTCNARGLSKLTGGNLRQTWLLNGREYQTVDHVDSSRNDILFIQNVMTNHSGIWECVNTHMKSQVTYDTAFIKVMILKEGTKFDPRRVKGLLTSILLVSVVGLALACYDLVIAKAVLLLSKRNYVLEKAVRKTNARYNMAQRKWIKKATKTKSKELILPQLLFHDSTTQRTSSRGNPSGGILRPHHLQWLTKRVNQD